MLAFFAILAQLIVCTIVFGVCLVFAVFFGFILIVHVLAWRRDRAADRDGAVFLRRKTS